MLFHDSFLAPARSLRWPVAAAACVMALLTIPAIGSAQEMEKPGQDRPTGQRLRARKANAKPTQEKPVQGKGALKSPANRLPQDQNLSSAEARRRAAEARRLRQKMAGAAMPKDGQKTGPVSGKLPPAKGAPNKKRSGNSNQAAGGALMQQWMRRLAQADANGDRKLSLEEAPAALKERFDRIDTNQDQFIDQREIRVAVQRLQERMGENERPAMNAEMAKRMRERLQQQQREEEATGRPVKPIRPGKLK